MRFVTFFFLLFFPLFSAFSAADRRDISSFWEGSILELQGHHRPHATIEVFEGEEKLGETVVESNAQFHIRLSIDKGKKHILTIRATDHLGREIKEDPVEALVLPGLTSQGTIRDAEGKVVPYATIRLLDTEGNLLNSVTADEYGRYRIPHTPANAQLEIWNKKEKLETISREEKEEQNINLKQIVDTTTEKEEKKYSSFFNKKEEKSIDQEKENKNFFSFSSLLTIIVFVVFAGVIALLFWKKKDRENQ